MVYLHAWENTYYVGYDTPLERNVGCIISMLSVKWDIIVMEFILEFDLTLNFEMIL